MSRLLGVLALAAVLLAFAVLVPTLGKAQNAPASPPSSIAQAQPVAGAGARALPAGYAGTEACKGCHEKYRVEK